MITAKERPILFNAPMVRAILAGDKTQTRRNMKAPCQELAERDDGTLWPWSEHPDKADDFWHPCPYGQVGDRLWVRETWRGIVEISPPDAVKPEYGVARYVPDQEHCKRVEYAATEKHDADPWRPSIHMPRWASRILLEITSVRVERLQDISEQDALAEGIDAEAARTALSFIGMREISGPVAEFSVLWESINGAGSWDANPWVWVVEFRRAK